MHSKVEWARYIPCKIPFGLENGGKTLSGFFIARKRLGFQNFDTFFNLGTSNHGRVVLRTLDPFLVPKAVSKFANVNSIFFFGVAKILPKNEIKN
jgi:hypothetical protein